MMGRMDENSGACRLWQERTAMAEMDGRRPGIKSGEEYEEQDIGNHAGGPGLSDIF